MRSLIELILLPPLLLPAKERAEAATPYFGQSHPNIPPTTMP